MSGLSRDVIIKNELGLHARSATRIAQIAQKGKSSIWVIKASIKADAASVIDILTLACEKGSKITIQIDDPSDMELLNEMADLVESGFGE
ncbi:MAG: HPr family phosphocarrier protein [Pseudomonadota bacterium]